MAILLVDLAGHCDLATNLAAALQAPLAGLEQRSFPDGETYLRYLTPVDGRDVVILCSLDRPDAKLAPLIFAAGAARDLGARSVGLVAPYLAYMRQDKRFATGEAVTSRYFAALLSAWLDWLVTVDPHLHRHKDLGAVYTIPTTAVHAAPLLAGWIRDNVSRPVLLGPDSESRQWVASVAADSQVPFAVLEKVRHGDHDVSISAPSLHRWRGCTPVLVDDIISTGQTLLESLRLMRDAGLGRPVCVGIHGLFAEGAFERLLQGGADRIVTTNAIAHTSNAIDLAPLLTTAIRTQLRMS